MEVGFRSLQGSFFDSDKVKRQLDRKTQRALSRFGAVVWRRSKSSLKYRSDKSAPGSPPSVHRSDKFARLKKSKGKEVRQASSPFRELRYFAWDSRTRSVVTLNLWAMFLTSWSCIDTSRRSAAPRWFRSSGIVLSCSNAWTGNRRAIPRRVA